MDAPFFDTLRGFKVTSRKHRIADDDFVDRFNHYHTSIMICVLSIIICAKQYIVGQPLQCWIPVEFKEGWEKYAENYCWVKNTYYIPRADELPDTPDERARYEIRYYQWVPFVLGLQALLFNVPKFFWQLLNWQSGIHIKSLMQTANDPGNISADKREESLELLCRYVTNSIFYTKEARNSIAVTIKRMIFKVVCCGNSQAGSYLLTTYMVMKILYLLNLICQFMIMNAFLGTSFDLFGLELLKRLSQGLTWESTAHFPRVTFCDFRIRSLGHVRPYTLQCVLVINMFNEKVYIFLWFWFAILFLATALNLLKWLSWILFARRRRKIIKRVLKTDITVTRNDINAFMDDLKTDGMFVLKMISLNAGDLLTNDLIKKLFYKYQTDKSEGRPTLWDAPEKS